jgi:hypothetical protein
VVGAVEVVVGAATRSGVPEVRAATVVDEPARSGPINVSRVSSVAIRSRGGGLCSSS